jgi:hypothetical protein
MNPMSSAPPDGTPVLIFGQWAGEINGPSKEPAGWYVAQYLFEGASDYPGYTWSVVGTDAYAAWVKPEGWAPLPPPADGDVIEALRAYFDEVEAEVRGHSSQSSVWRSHSRVDFYLHEKTRALLGALP